MDTLRIATRKSPLALWQAEYAAARLARHHPELSVALVEVSTTGDRGLDVPLANIGGKGLFMKELEVALLEGRADIAVHSMKDVVVQLPQGFAISAICERDDPLDAFVSNDHESLERLPDGARVGTCSLRRQAQLRAAFPALKVMNLRGNVNTRLRKLDSGEFDAIILAAAGLKRLEMQERIRHTIDAAVSLPAVGQGAVGIETRIDDFAVHDLVKPLDHEPTRRCVEAERALNEQLEGGCQVPIGAFARIPGDRMVLDGLVGSIDGRRILRTRVEGTPDDPSRLGRRAAEELVTRGARDILREVLEQSQSRQP